MSAINGNGNGKAEWLWRIGTVLLAAIMAYTALSARVSVLEERQRLNFEDIVRRLDRIESKIP